jgi:hypothetical protein
MNKKYVRAFVTRVSEREREIGFDVDFNFFFGFERGAFSSLAISPSPS